MAVEQRKIQILFEYLTKGAQRANAAAEKANRAITTTQRRYADANKTGKRRIETTRNNMVANSKAGQVMRMNQEVLGRFNKEGRRFNTAGGRMANRFRMMTHGARGFRMELLGVMFFGMAMNRVFMGLLKTSLEWMGVTEILSQTLGILFLPIAEVVLEWALKFLDFVLDLTETEKKAVGWFTLVGAAVGGLLFIMGTLGLGIGSMILAFNFSKIANIIGSQGLGGIQTAAKKASDKVTNLKSNLGKMVKIAAAAILISIAIKDLKEGQVIAAVGGTAMAAGVIMGGKAGGAVFVIGVALKLFGDEEFMIDTIKVMYRIGNVVSSILKEAILSGLTMRAFDPSKIEGFANIGRAFKIASEQISMEDAMKGVGDSIIYPTAQIQKLRDEQVKLQEQFEAGFDTGASIDALQDKIVELDNTYSFAEEKVKDFRKEVEKPIKITMGDVLSKLFMPKIFPLLGFQSGGIIPGPIGSPIPILAHGGETVIPAGGSQGIIISPTYHVVVSDKREFEAMLSENNRTLTEDVRRLIKT